MESDSALLPQPNLLAEIRRRPGLYFGEKSISGLYFYRTGFIAGAKGDSQSLPLPDDFDDWVAYRARFSESTSGWRNMLLEKSGGDEELAFDRFFELLDEHRARVSRVIARFNMTVTFLMPSPDLAWEDFENLEKISHDVRASVVIYTDDPGFFVIPESDTMPGRTFYPDFSRFEIFVNEPRDWEILDSDACEKAGLPVR
ncbi:hypothetical protein [Luteolibacter sp. LG18]|uniref:hypothetical protein n=1 Tax=Luteolibacter sp. LG18 TaxID=2819286 RepID=UPI0030C73160